MPRPLVKWRIGVLAPLRRSLAEKHLFSGVVVSRPAPFAWPATIAGTLSYKNLYRASTRAGRWTMTEGFGLGQEAPLLRRFLPQPEPLGHRPPACASACAVKILVAECARDGSGPSKRSRATHDNAAEQVLLGERSPEGCQ